MNKKVLAMVLAVVLLMTAAISGTIAWLTDDTDPVVNTFTVGNIDITLTETGAVEDTENKVWEKSYKMVPGNVLSKDPKVTVLGKSEDCWLFVKVEETLAVGKDQKGNTVNYEAKEFFDYAIASGWFELDKTKHPGVYYRKVSASDADQAFYVLAGDTNNPGGIVTVNTTVTKEMMDSLNASDATLPQLKFTAYAIQTENLDYEGKTVEVDQAAIAWGYITTP